MASLMSASSFVRTATSQRATVYRAIASAVQVTLSRVLAD
jgi:hypothetical protein